MKVFLANGIFFFGLLPFISPFPIGSDTQPIAFLFSSVFIFLLFLEKNLKLSFTESIFIFLSIFSLFYLGFDNDYSFEARHRLGLTIAAITFIAAIKSYHLFSMKVLIFASVINFVGVLWHLLFTESFIFFAELFVRKIKLSEFAGRGASGFAPENSFTAVVAIFHGLIAYFFYNQEKRLERKQFLLVIFLSFLTIILTGSGSGYLFTASVGLIFIFSRLTFKKLINYSVIAAFIYTALILSPIKDNRGVVLLKLLVTNPSLILIDGSVAERMLAVEIGLRGMFLHPFGKGAGSYQDVSEEVEAKYSLSNKYPSARSEGLFKETISSFSRYLTEIGIIYFFLVLLLFLKPLKNDSYTLMTLYLSFLMFVVSFSIIFPPIYLLLATVHRQEKVYAA